MSHIDRKRARAIGDAIKAAIEPVAASFNLTLEPLRASFDSTMLRIRIEMKAPGAGLANWQVGARLFGLPLDGVGRSFELRGRIYTINGITITRRSYPVSVTRDDGRAFKFPAETVRQAFAQQEEK